MLQSVNHRDFQFIALFKLKLNFITIYETSPNQPMIGKTNFNSHSASVKETSSFLKLKAFVCDDEKKGRKQQRTQKIPSIS